MLVPVLPEDAYLKDKLNPIVNVMGTQTTISVA